MPLETCSDQSPSGRSFGSAKAPSAEPCAESVAGETGTLAPSGPLTEIVAWVISGSAHDWPARLRTNAFQNTVCPGR